MITQQESSAAQQQPQELSARARQLAQELADQVELPVLELAVHLRTGGRAAHTG